MECRDTTPPPPYMELLACHLLPQSPFRGGGADFFPFENYYDLKGSKKSLSGVSIWEGGYLCSFFLSGRFVAGRSFGPGSFEVATGGSSDPSFASVDFMDGTDQSALGIFFWELLFFVYFISTFFCKFERWFPPKK